MSELISITKVAMDMNISSRSLRYWESSGLFSSTRDAESGWRLYDEKALQSIRITELLRRLDIPIIEIKEILDNRSVETVRKVLKNQLDKLNKAGADLNSRKAAISKLISALNENVLFSPDSLENVLLPITLERKKANITKRREVFNMENLNTENSNLFNEVQFIELPPMRTAAYSCVGVEPEDEAVEPVLKWIKANNLLGTMRLFGFNVEPYPTEENPAYGFGYCASIPEGIEIPKPLYEWRLPGGTYAVISKYTGDPSHGWKKVQKLLSDSNWEWEYDGDRHPGLEEHISRGDRPGYLIPILIPVKKKIK